ncbi:MAG: division/cell wall cluster transcriptional repressor MraZ [Elusimicrobia bacterium]|nr:division/cell wall cluster transcriptional repressor MraZ [Elusimicrobiota bacterium]
MPALTGRYEHTLDDKSRMFVPSRYREQLTEENGKRFHIVKGADGCLWLFLPSQWERFTAEANAKPFKSPQDKRAFVRELFSRSVEPMLDEQGRITLPQVLKDSVGLRKDLVVLGVGSRAEIWDKATLEKREKAAAKDFDRVISSMDL